jgi:hypothetical protein
MRANTVRSVSSGRTSTAPPSSWRLMTRSRTVPDRVRSIQPSCARKASLNTLERYFAPESQTRLTTRLGLLCSLQ